MRSPSPRQASKIFAFNEVTETSADLDPDAEMKLRV